MNIFENSSRDFRYKVKCPAAMCLINTYSNCFIPVRFAPFYKLALSVKNS